MPAVPCSGFSTLLTATAIRTCSHCNWYLYAEDAAGNDLVSRLGDAIHLSENSSMNGVASSGITSGFDWSRCEIFIPIFATNIYASRTRKILKKHSKNYGARIVLFPPQRRRAFKIMSWPCGRWDVNRRLLYLNSRWSRMPSPVITNSDGGLSICKQSIPYSRVILVTIRAQN